MKHTYICVCQIKVVLVIKVIKNYVSLKTDFCNFFEESRIAHLVLDLSIWTAVPSTGISHADFHKDVNIWKALDQRWLTMTTVDSEILGVEVHRS